MNGVESCRGHVWVNHVGHGKITLSRFKTTKESKPQISQCEYVVNLLPRLSDDVMNSGMKDMAWSPMTPPQN